MEDKTILSLPTFMVTDEASKQKNQPKKVSNYDKAVLAKSVKVYFRHLDFRGIGRHGRIGVVREEQGIGRSHSNRKGF